MYSTVKKQIHILLDPSEGASFWDKLIDGFIITLILLNVLAVILETVHSLFVAYESAFHYFELFSVSIFTLEYVLRLWTCTCIARYKHPITGRLRYIFSFAALVDLLAILPFYLPILTFYDLRFVRIFRLLRLLRVFKLGRYLNATRIVSNVFKSKKEELILCLVITISLIIVASSLMYFAEHDAQPDKFSSIPATMWWGVTTLTTVGYGDVYPITAIGRTLTAFISILGIGVFALPAGILASGFSAEFQKLKKEKTRVPTLRQRAYQQPIAAYACQCRRVWIGNVLLVKKSYSVVLCMKRCGAKDSGLVALHRIILQTLTQPCIQHSTGVA